MTKIVRDILQMDDAEMICKALNDALEEERKKREYFYNEVTEYEKAEFILGEIVVHSPVKKWHSVALKLLLKVLDTYVQINDLGHVGFEKDLIRLGRNDYEPDICFFKKEVADTFKDDQVFYPAPHFIVEILSKSTETRDRGIKFKDYERHQIQEYWIIDPETQTLEQYILTNGKYEIMTKSSTGLVKSVMVKGFEIPIPAIFDKKENVLALKNLG